MPHARARGKGEESRDTWVKLLKNERTEKQAGVQGPQSRGGVQGQLPCWGGCRGNARVGEAGGGGGGGWGGAGATPVLGGGAGGQSLASTEATRPPSSS